MSTTAHFFENGLDHRIGPRDVRVPQTVKATLKFVKPPIQCLPRTLSSEAAGV